MRLRGASGSTGGVVGAECAWISARTCRFPRLTRVPARPGTPAVARYWLAGENRQGLTLSRRLRPVPGSGSVAGRCTVVMSTEPSRPD